MAQLPALPPSLLPPPEGNETAHQLNVMRAGQSYSAGDPYLMRLRDRGQAILEEFEKFKSNTTKRMEYMRKVCVFEDAEGENDVAVMPGFTCEYWFNISFGKEIFIAHNCFCADVAPISIGSRTMIGPNVQLLTPTHPISPEERNGLQGPEGAQPITIGKDCWIGGGVIILAGVTIGDGSTVGAGSVVTRSVPPRHVVVGNPAKPVKRIELDGTVIDVRAKPSA